MLKLKIKLMCNSTDPSFQRHTTIIFSKYIKVRGKTRDNVSINLKEAKDKDFNDKLGMKV